MDDAYDRRRVLLVEAHTGLRRDLARALESLGYETDAFVSCAELPPAMSRPPYAVHLLEVAAGSDSDSLEALGLQEGRSIWMSSASDGPSWGPFARSRQERLLTKPFSIRALERCITDCLHVSTHTPASTGDPILSTREPRLSAEIDRARAIARQEVAVVIEGELGSGRRALAAAIHGWSPRHAAGYTCLDRAEIDSAGQTQARVRLHEVLVRARGGSLVLVEPADWPPWAQRELTIALRYQAHDVRTLTVSGESLERSVREGRLSVELAYRLDVAQLSMPPLRERSCDQLAMCTAVARRVSRSLGRMTPIVDEALVTQLARDGFPGNQIGLESRLRSALIRSDEADERIDRALVHETAPEPAEADPTASLHLKTLERDTIIRALAHWQGNRTRASESLGISVRTLRNKIRDLELR